MRKSTFSAKQLHLRDNASESRWFLKVVSTLVTMPEKLSTHAGFIKAISPWLPDSTGREGLYSCRTDSAWSSVLLSPICCSECRWRGSGPTVCRPSEGSWSSTPPRWGLALKERGESAWMLDGTSVSSQEANNSFSSEERVGEVCVSFDIIRSERIWERSLEWQPSRAHSRETDPWYSMATSKQLGCFWNFSTSPGWFVLLRLISPHKRKVRQTLPPPLPSPIGSVEWIFACLAGQTSGVSVKKDYLSLLLSSGADRYHSTLVLHKSAIWSHFCRRVITTSQVGANRLYRTFHEPTTAIF